MTCASASSRCRPRGGPDIVRVYRQAEPHGSVSITVAKEITQSGGNELWTAVALVGGGVLAGGAAGYLLSPTITRVQQGSMGAVLGGLVAATAGSAMAVSTPAWRDVGERMALVGLLGFTSLALLSTLGIGSSSTVATTPAPTNAPALPATTAGTA